MQLGIGGRRLLLQGTKDIRGHKKTPEKYCLFIQYTPGVLKARTYPRAVFI
jgi:hypothetical protein